MTDREALLACWRSGQISAAQFERHCENDPELRKMVEAPKRADPIAAVLEALKPFAKVADHIHEMLSDEATGHGGGIKVKDFRRARAALAAYDAAVSPSRQSADIEAMARELAKRASSGDTLAQSRIESNLLSFAARVAADQRERDAKIAETPDPQLANKTAAQIAAAIRASAKPF